MVNKVEKISPAKRVTSDVGKYGQRSGYADDNTGQSYGKQIKPEKQKEPNQGQGDSQLSEAYVVHLDRATQSLFYEDGSAVKELLREIHES